MKWKSQFFLPFYNTFQENDYYSYMYLFTNINVEMSSKPILSYTKQYKYLLIYRATWLYVLLYIMCYFILYVLLHIIYVLLYIICVTLYYMCYFILYYMCYFVLYVTSYYVLLHIICVTLYYMCYFLASYSLTSGLPTKQYSWYATCKSRCRRYISKPQCRIHLSSDVT
jgi:hypothetical protein